MSAHPRLLIVAVLLGSCSTVTISRAAGPDDRVSGTSPVTITSLPPMTAATPTTAPPPASTSADPPPATATTAAPSDLKGIVLTPDGDPLRFAVVSAGGDTVTTKANGRFAFEDVPAGWVRVDRPAWLSQRVMWDGAGPLRVTLEPRIVRGVRAIPDVAGDPARFSALLDLVEGTVINAIVFDSKDETGHVRYETAVPEALEMGAVDPVYDTGEVLAAVEERGLYAIMRVVTFEDVLWTARDPGAKLAGWWVDPRDRANWAYPLGVAEEACRLGFDEVQFDYVRFPTGETAAIAQAEEPATADERVAAIRAFLTAARKRLHPLGCAVSAAIFGITMSSSGDEGVGQRPDELSHAVDALSPMIYPSHYAPGWIGFEDPNEHPTALTAHALDTGGSRMRADTVLRPWLQAFFYTPDQIRAAIAAAEDRGCGWILWNAASNYTKAAIPEG